MNATTKIIIPIVGLLIALLLAFVAYFVVQSWWSQPPAVLGFGDGPEQPIAFPHQAHVNVAGLDCQFCHRTVSAEETAGIPAVNQCRFCHDFDRITGSKSESSSAEAEIKKLIGTLGENPDPINWVRVHRLPDHVQFLHAPHIQQGFSCSTCHGDIASMKVVEQVRNLKMRDCVDCHRENNAPTDCTTCHY
ncbi:MAG: molecular chaperone [Chloroflexi bacterium]|nr:molecular chaperone [Chloroflexota bacterium]|tara:strand:- start:1625 stop:2197 length:573 start_codon:yes stop_codon:yes gene_type:complete